jgi:hypothetical protein
MNSKIPYSKKTITLMSSFVIMSAIYSTPANALTQQQSEQINYFMNELDSASFYLKAEAIYLEFHKWSEGQIRAKELDISELEPSYRKFCSMALAFSKEVPESQKIILSIKLQVTDKRTTDILNKKFINPGKLLGSHNYHVTLGIIENVITPCSESLKIDINNYFHSNYPNFLLTSEFIAESASTFVLMGLEIYSGNSVILTPKNTNLFKTFNTALNDLLQEKNTKENTDYYIDWNTHPKRFTPHITLRTPQAKDRSKSPISQ